MERVTTLFDLVTNLESLDEDATIYAVEPWTCDTSAVALPEPLSGKVPDAVAKAGMTYFLNISVVREFLEDWDSGPGRGDSPRERCERLIEYAINDA